MISGKVYDALNQETLPGANVYFSDAAGSPGSATNGTATDINGNYSFSKISGTYLTASFIGYKRQTMIATDGVINFAMEPDSITLQEVEIIAKRPDTIDWKRILLIGGLSLLGVTLLVLSFKKR